MGEIQAGLVDLPQKRISRRTSFLQSIKLAGPLLMLGGCPRGQDANTEVTEPKERHWAALPLRIDPCIHGVFSYTSELKFNSAFRYVRALAPSVSDYCHLLRRFRSSLASYSDRSETELLRCLLDDEFGAVAFGKNVLIRTSHGVRYRTASDSSPGESHKDQVLAALAERQVGLATPMKVGGQSLAVVDLLLDSIASFHFEQEELWWTAVAYALYIPPKTSWTNRYGEEFTFDSLLEEILRRGLDVGQCGGAHFLYSLTILIRVDLLRPIFSQELRGYAYAEIRKYITLIVEQQSDSGEWSPKWIDPDFEKIEVAWKPEERVLVRLALTGHYLEWMTFLPLRLQPSLNIYHSAFLWLQNVDTEHPLLSAAFCPKTHAWLACAILVQKQ